MAPRQGVLAAAAALALSLAGCGSASPPPAPPPTATLPPAAEVPPMDSVPGTPPSVPSVVVWDDAAKQQATDAGRAAITAYLRKGLDPGPWATQLAEHLTAEGQAAYLGEDLAHPTT